MDICQKLVRVHIYSHCTVIKAETFCAVESFSQGIPSQFSISILTTFCFKFQYTTSRSGVVSRKTLKSFSLSASHLQYPYKCTAQAKTLPLHDQVHPQHIRAEVFRDLSQCYACTPIREMLHREICESTTRSLVHRL